MNTIITIGTGNSGCGSIHDFLVKSTKYKSPFKGQEFRMMDDPEGILNLYHNFYTNRSINNYSNAIMRFKNYVENLIHLEMNINGKITKIYNKEVLSLTNDYIKNITTLNYNSFPQFIALQTNLFKKKYFHYKKIISGNKNQSFFKMYLPVDEKVFFKQSIIYLNKIVKSQLKNKKTDHIVLDQALNMLNFVDIFSYFKNVKVIIVTRDPRGIWNSMKSRGSLAYPHYNLKVWAAWYDQIMQQFEVYKKRIPKKYMKNILQIKFEDFVKNYEKEQIKILKFLNTNKINENFDIGQSKFNAFKAKHHLSSYETNYIKKRLKKHLQW